MRLSYVAVTRAKSHLICTTSRWRDGSTLGEVSDVLNLPGQDVLVIKGESGEVLIPFVRVLVPVVDIAGKRLTVIPPIIDGQMS